MTENNSEESNDLSDAVIRGKVVSFVSKRELIINVGASDGVKVGMRFAVLKPGGREVRDEDGKLLGTVEAAKTVVKVVRVEGDHLSVARTFLTIKGSPAIEGTDPMEILRRQSQINFLSVWRERQAATPDRVETFKVDRRETLNDFDMNVERGDEVRLTTGDEFIFPEWAREDS